MMTVAAVACFAVAKAQDGTVAPATDATVPAEQVQTAPLQSAYHACLLDAGKETWTVLGLDESQVARVTALQERYKAELNPPKETPATKGKKAVAVTKEAKAEPAVAAVPSVEATEPVDKTGVALENTSDEVRPLELDEPIIELPNEALLTPDPALEVALVNAPPDPAAGDELQAILTPAQWNLWHKQCYHELEPTGMIQP